VKLAIAGAGGGCQLAGDPDDLVSIEHMFDYQGAAAQPWAETPFDHPAHARRGRPRPTTNLVRCDISLRCVMGHLPVSGRPG
jgi:hypothetical protein